MSQKEINDFGHDQARAGLIFSSNTNVINTGIIQEDVDAAGGFPVWGKQGDGDKCYSQKPASGGYVKGIVKDLNFKDYYKEGDVVSIVRKGQIWVQVSDDVVDGTQVYVDPTTGAFGNSVLDDGTETQELIVGAIYKTSAATDGFAVVELG